MVVRCWAVWALARSIPDPARPWIRRLPAPASPVVPFVRVRVREGGPSGGWVGYWLTVSPKVAVWEAQRWDDPIARPPDRLSPRQRAWQRDHQNAPGQGLDQRRSRFDLEDQDATMADRPDEESSLQTGDCWPLRFRDLDDAVVGASAVDSVTGAPGLDHRARTAAWGLAPAHLLGRAGRPPGRAVPAPLEGSEMTHESPSPLSDSPRPRLKSPPDPAGPALGKTRTTPPSLLTDPGQQLQLPGFSVSEAP